MEGLRRQYEFSPQAYSLNRALGNQLTAQFARTYGQSPQASVEPQVAMDAGVTPVDYGAGVSPSIGAPSYTTNIEELLKRNEEAKKITTKKYQAGEI